MSVTLVSTDVWGVQRLAIAVERSLGAAPMGWVAGRCKGGILREEAYQEARSAAEAWLPAGS